MEEAALTAARAAGFQQDALEAIGLAVREAAINAVRHGNRFSPDLAVSVSIDSSSTELLITMADQGSGFSPGDVPDPLQPENILRGSGRGLFLMRALMDEVEVDSGASGTTVTLVKRRAAATEV